MARSAGPWVRGAAIRHDSWGIGDGCPAREAEGYSPSGTAEIPVAASCCEAARDAAVFARSAIWRSIFANSGLNLGDLAQATGLRARASLSEKKAREKAEAIRRARKLARKKAQREGMM